MAFDSLQVPATIINNDKLISMAGNLMAKEKADKDKRDTAFINQMAKVDSSGLRQGDINKFKTKYNDLINYGSKADLESIEGQTEIARRLNELNAFVNISKNQKETIDVPLLKMRFEKDFDPKNTAYIEQIIATPTDELGSIDFNRLKRIDDKDYGAEALKMFEVDITSNIDGVELKNMDERAIRERVSSLMNSKANLPTVQKAVLQVGGGDAGKGVDMLQEMIVQETLAKQSQNIKAPSEVQKTKDFFKKNKYHEELIPALNFVGDLTYALAKGDPKAAKMLQELSLEQIYINDDGKQIIVSTDEDGENVIQKFDRSNTMAELGRQVAGFTNNYGKKGGFAQIPLYEYDAFIKDPNYSKYGKAAMPIKGSIAEIESKKNPSYFNAFKTNVPLVKTAATKSAPIPQIPKQPAPPKPKEPQNIGVLDSLIPNINITPKVGVKKKINNESEVVIETKPIAIKSDEDIYNRVKEHEGVKNTIYKDSKGNPTIGVGFNLNRSDANKRLKSVGADPKLIKSGKGQLTEKQIDTLYKEDLNKAKNSAKKLVSKTWDELPKGVQGALTEMAFNLGEGGLSEFKNTLGYIEEKRFKLAAQSMLKSKWARQVGDRAKRLANIIENA